MRKTCVHCETRVIFVYMYFSFKIKGTKLFVHYYTTYYNGSTKMNTDETRLPSDRGYEWTNSVQSFTVNITTCTYKYLLQMFVFIIKTSGYFNFHVFQHTLLEVIAIINKSECSKV